MQSLRDRLHGFALTSQLGAAFWFFAAVVIIFAAYYLIPE